MANIVYIAASLDGYIADDNDNIDWLINLPNPDNSDFGFSEFMEWIDALVMGRKTFEVVSGFEEWPYRKPVFVLSSSLEKIPESLREKAELILGEPKEIVESLRLRGYNNLYVDGGKTIQSFLEQNLIDEMIITHAPILLGSGKPLFGKMSGKIQFKHISTEVYENGLVKSRYMK